MVLKFRNKAFDFFSKLTVKLSYNSVGSVFRFEGFFQNDFDDHKTIFKPLSYPQITVENDGELLLTGTVLNHDFNVESVKGLTALQGYSLPGVLEDCNIPVSLYPLQSDKRTLKEIAERLVAPFGVEIEIDSDVSADMDKKFDVSTADEGQTIKAYLNELASQRNIVLSHTPEGKLLFTKAATTKTPIARFEESPSVQIGLKVNGQKMFSETTVQRQASIKTTNAGESTIENPYVSAYRTLVKTQSSGDDNDTEQAAKSALAAQLQNIRLTISVDRWTWRNKESSAIMKPNEIITVVSPENYIYEETRFFVESVEFTRDQKKETAQLICALPEVYSRETPKNIFE